ncbi:peptidoglycan-binding protein [Spirilliplanes yamanashiensis]|uniref:Uncharacterized protein n=1 Tax=Spirilliplanes yamanashiensis TaxID=42233 RepID=A0A8J4DJ76_9ACTN|nr:peptidoglycan-binding protein [Spirilliplanes yamanashiensis]MDP9815628.1 hypothetical protein [Spirilliplanes yamanashiensis]GIJ03882.1 hypothetical protein Sya03_32340 [Spirilliplanes yamanashiensis]
MGTLSWGSTGDEVVKLQQMLADLGHYAGPLDGRFGPLTRAAVQAFQRAAGLPADGIVGPRTWAALADVPQEPGGGGPVGGGEPAQPVPAGDDRAVSLHIGVNRVDPARYGGWDGALSGCENDARTMTAIATAEGFTTRQLFTRQATVANVLAAIADAAARLTAGGTFLLTYAGHGGQVQDAGTDEDDRQDETWVLFDRQLLDDEINLALADFRPGVHVVTVSDSCHSGTVTRSLRDPVQRAVADLKRAFYTGLAVARPGPGEPAVTAFPRPAAAARQLAVRAAVRSGPLRFPGQRPTGDGGRNGGVATLDRPAGVTDDVVTREIPLLTNLEVNELQAGELAAARARSRGARALVRANCLHLSGCEDSQLSQETGGRGVFTTALERTWAGGAFAGTYPAFHRAIVAQLGPTQTPCIDTFGGDPAALAARTPFDT